MQKLRQKFYDWLRLSERVFKTDMVYVAKGGFWTTLFFIISTLASIVTMIAFGNLFSKEHYGTYSYLLSLGASLGFLTLSGIATAVVRSVARGYENVVPEALRLQLKYNLLAVFSILLVAVYYGYQGNSLFASSLVLIAIAYPVGQSFHIYVQVLTGQKRFDLLTKLGSLVTLVSTSLTVATLFLTDSVFILIAVYSFLALVPNIVVYIWVARRLNNSSPDPQQIKELKRSAFHLTGAGFISTAAQYIDKIVLFQIAGPTSLAIYGFAIAGPDRLKSLMKTWMGIAFPKLAERNIAEIHSMFYKRLGLSLILGIILAGIYIGLSPFLFKWFLPKYLDSIIYSQVYALGLVIVPALVFVGNIFYSQNMLRAVYMSGTGAQLLRIALILLLGWKWQVWGLVFAGVASQVLNTIYYIYIWERERLRLQKIGPKPINKYE